MKRMNLNIHARRRAEVGMRNTNEVAALVAAEGTIG